MQGFVDLAYRDPYVRHYKAFDAGFYVDFAQQLRLMGRWLQERGCRATLDIGAMTGGCIEYISGLGMRMDGVQFTPDIRKLAAANLKRHGIASTLHVSPVDRPLQVRSRRRYDGVVSLGWFNLPHSESSLRRTLGRIRRLLNPGGVFLFDFFRFRELVVASTESVDLEPGLTLVSHAERRGDVLRRYHFWIRDSRSIEAETSDLVDRSAADARRLLSAEGFRVVRRRHLDLNYPREFWMAQRR
ncbi:MAG: class I SAM-dependent methyltransferase [Planctomycetaceae bacterium]|nr:class I SAM-dependent methyltransferase [Planctomycetaceae bacterium]